MNKLCLLFAFLLIASLPNMAAPGYVENIVNESEGNVTIDIPTDIMNIIFPPEKPQENRRQTRRNADVVTLHTGVNKLSGYRIQVFSQGNGHGSLETKARARASAVCAKFPKYRGQSYTYSSGPNWYTRVGNFFTKQEAQRALGELKRAFPQFAGEMTVVKSQITIVR